MHIAMSLEQSTLAGLKVAALAAFVFFIVKPVYDYYRDSHDLRQFPAVCPWAALTNLWYMYNTWSHQRYIKVHAAHQKHAIVRIGPKHLSFGEAEAIRDVLGHGVFLRKSNFYAVLSGSHRHVVDEQDRAEHSRKRKVLATVYSAKSVAGYEPVVVDKIRTVLRNFDGFCSKPLKEGEAVTDAETFNYRLWSNMLTFEVVAKIGASQDLGMLDRGTDLVEVETLGGKVYTTHAIRSLHESTKISVTFAWSTSWYKLNQWLTQLHPGWWHGRAWVDFNVRVARNRLNLDKEGERMGDFLGSLLYDREQKSREPEFGEVLAETNIMMNAGSDTTAIAMTNFLYIVMKHPHIMAKLRSEIDEVMKDEDPNMDVVPHAKARNLPYLKACIDESLRLWPPTGVGLPRETPEGGATILEHHIPGGITVSVPIFTAHRDPRVWQRPDEFVPERWLAEDAPILMSRYFMPFSFGGRACIGRNISYLEQQIFLATILRRYEFAFKHPDWQIERVEGMNTWPQAFPLKIWRRQIPTAW